MRTLRMILGFGLVMILCALPARAADPIRYRDIVFESANVTRGLVYDESHSLELDLYQPNGDTATDRAAIVLAHGGGFTSGAREDMATIAEAFALYGYVTVSISYRLDPDLGYEELIIGSLAGELPEAMHNAQHDMQAAVRWLRANAAAWGVDGELISAGGVSAGASMSLETAYNPEDDADDGAVSSDISAAVSISGATDPRRIEPGAPPVALFNGVLDTTAPFPTALLTFAGSTAQGNVVELTPFLTDGHDLSAHNASIIDDASVFLCEYVIGCS